MSPGPETAAGSPLADIVRVSRLLGSDPALVLHGGGNTSVKGYQRDVTGEEVEVVWVKGSGWNLASIEQPGFAPLRRARLLELARLDTLSDTAMVNELKQASLDAAAPAASIEAILHAVLPARVVLHSHADAVVAVTNTERGESFVREVFGDDVAVLPYVKPGFDLARAVAQLPEVAHGRVDALVLMNHGLFTFADSADEALERHRELVSRAGAALGAPLDAPAGDDGGGEGGGARPGSARDIAALRRELSRAASRPMILRQSASARARHFASRSDLDAVTSRGTITPEHVIRTKRLPLLGRDVAGYAEAYRAYVERNRPRVVGELEPLDPAPRVVLDPELGLLTAGATVSDASAVEDLYRHTIAVVDAADASGGYRSLGEAETFDIEYWELEQARIRRLGAEPPLRGEVALVTGAASGIGRAVAERLLAAGAAVVGVDLAASVREVFAGPAWIGVPGDAADPEVLEQAVERAVRAFGGVDVVVAAAGIFASPAPVHEVSDTDWERSLRVNSAAVLRCMRATHPYLALAPRGGRFVLVSTKNVAAPGPGAAAYSASKAAAAQLMRVAALEWAADGIRVNAVEPDAVFDTGIWTPELLRERAASYGLTEEQYRTRNLLGVEVTSADVAEAVLAVASTTLGATTGARLTVDGGNERVI